MHTAKLCQRTFQRVLPTSKASRSRSSLSVSAASMNDPVVSAQWLKDRLGQPGIKVLDGSWYMAIQGRNAKAEYKAKRIPGARFFDVDGICDPNTDLPHMLPSNAAFSAAADALGVSASDTLVVYDGMGVYSAPRVWWTFKVFGHQQVYVLEGGLPAWEAVGGELDTSEPADDLITGPTAKSRAVGAARSTTLGAYPAQLDTSKVRAVNQMVDNISKPVEQVVDARSHGRFIGQDPEPRPGLKLGHIPGSRNVPFPDVLAPGGQLKPPAELQAVFQSAGIKVDEPLVCTCGSGLTACILGIAVYKATGGKNLVSVYDGSWSEWGARPEVPVATGEA